MGTRKQSIVDHLLGEQPIVEAWSAIADTFAGRVHVEWDATAPVTPFGQLPFFIDHLKQAGLFERVMARAERDDLVYLFRLRMTANVSGRCNARCSNPTGRTLARAGSRFLKESRPWRELPIRCRSSTFRYCAARCSGRRSKRGGLLCQEDARASCC